uniref:Protein NRT1/ PTR FAMILY 5.10-like n=1 Tax=Ananas comosus var. bracteatus TaxID=296719 RepID=A0A6V7Q7C3_ANACO|nr:unnamed protein product [Ananas comosus var. bracteatus]
MDFDDPLLNLNLLPQQSSKIVGAVDFRGRPVSAPNPAAGPPPSSCGDYREICVLRDIGEPDNILDGPLGEGTAAAAAAINTWSGVASMVPLLGALVADSFLGRFRTILLASLVYVLGLGMLTLSSVLSRCDRDAIDGTKCAHSSFKVTLFYVSLYIVALAQGGHQPCIQAFGADQFDETDPEERIAKSSFFNWWYFGLCAGATVTLIVSSYIQDNIGWGLGFGIPCIIMFFALVVFLLGTRTYRYYVLDEESPCARVGKAFMAWIRSFRATKFSRS